MHPTIIIKTAGFKLSLMGGTGMGNTESELIEPTQFDLDHT